jgi:hypothetical protein
MRVMMLLADYANVTNNGKMNVMGIFSQILAKSFPCKHHSMVLIAQVGLDIGERAVPRPIAFRLMPPEGAPLVEITGELNFRQNEDGHIEDANIIISLNDIVFPEAGDYEIRFYIHEETKHSLSIKVIQIEDPT